MADDKNLMLARLAREEKNSEDAKLYYGKVRDDDPTNGEAKFFYAYYSLHEGKNGELARRFSNLCNALISAISFVGNSSAPRDEKLGVLADIAAYFVPETWAEIQYMHSKNTSSVTVFSTSEIQDCTTNGMNALKKSGDMISTIDPADPEYRQIAVKAWKEFVSLARKYFSLVSDEEAQAYADKIKKVDPSYEIPKKAGCISFSNTKN